MILTLCKSKRMKNVKKNNIFKDTKTVEYGQQSLLGLNFKKVL